MGMWVSSKDTIRILAHSITISPVLWLYRGRKPMYAMKNAIKVTSEHLPQSSDRWRCNKRVKQPGKYQIDTSLMTILTSLPGFPEGPEGPRGPRAPYNIREGIHQTGSNMMLFGLYKCKYIVKCNCYSMLKVNVMNVSVSEDAVQSWQAAIMTPPREVCWGIMLWCSATLFRFFWFQTSSEDEFYSSIVHGQWSALLGSPKWFDFTGANNPKEADISLFLTDILWLHVSFVVSQSEINLTAKQPEREHTVV